MVDGNNNIEVNEYFETYKHNLGESIRKERIKRRFPLFHLACKCNISSTYLGYIINAKKNPSLEVLLRIANGLELSMSEIFLEVEKLMKGED